jgi:hypothetical protein
MTRYATEIMQRRRAAAASFTDDVVLVRALRAGEQLRFEGRLTEDGLVWSVLDADGQCVCRPVTEDSFVPIPL